MLQKLHPRTMTARVGLLLLGCDAAHAHGYLTRPRPRPPLWAAESGMQGHTGAAATYRWAEPVFTLDGPRVSSGHRYRADSYSCHDFKAETPQTTITAGESLDLAWTFEAAHPGDCSLYISFDAEVRRGLVTPPPLQTETQHANDTPPTLHRSTHPPTGSSSPTFRGASIRPRWIPSMGEPQTRTTSGR